MNKKNIILLCILVCIFLGNIQLFSQEFKVIVNESNPITKLKRDVISDIFLKKVDTFPNGQSAMPVDLVPDDPIREKFSQIIHKRRVEAVESYWQQRIFSGQAVPPPKKKSEIEIIEYVINNPGGIGYVSVSISSPGIKAIEID